MDHRIFHLGHNSHSLSVGVGSSGWNWRYDGGNEIYGSVSHGADYVLAYTRPSGGNYASAKLFINGTEQTRTSGANDTGSPTSTTAIFKVGSNYSDGTCLNGYIGEIIVIESDSNSDRYEIEGYLAHKWGLASALPSNHNYYSSWPDIFITTGQPVSIQIPATRNPTSWSAAGLPSGLSVNNSGTITGFTSAIGNHNATLTASNQDGNHSKSISFSVTKGQRIIAWDQNFTNITYGGTPITLNATATGTDLTVTNHPDTISGLKLWSDASALSTAVPPGRTVAGKEPMPPRTAAQLLSLMLKMDCR